MAGYFELKHAANGQFMFNLKGGNHETVLTSETYKSKVGAEGGIAAVRINAPLDSRYRRKTATNRLPFFVLVGGNGEPIGTSETYSSTSAMERGIDAVKREAPSAPVKDLTR